MSFTLSPVRRDLGLVAAGRGLSVIGDEVALIALLLWASAAGHGALLVAALVMAAALPQLVLAPLAGTVVDRLPARALIAVTSLVQALSCWVMAGLLDSVGAAVLVGLVVVLNIGQTLVSPAWAALIPEIVGRADVARGLAAVQTATAAAALVGPVVGGALVGFKGVAWALAIDGISFALLAATVLLIRSDRRPEPGAAREPGAMLAGVRLVAADPVLRGIVGLLATMILAIGAVNVAEVFLVTQTLGASPAAYGVVGALFAVGLVVGGRLARRDADERVLVRRVVHATLTMAVAIVALGLAPTVAVAAAASLVIGAGNGMLNVSGQTLVVRRTPPALLGRAFAALQGVVGASMLVATALGGVLLGLLDTRVVVAGCGAFAVVALSMVGGALVRAVRTAPLASTGESPPCTEPAGDDDVPVSVAGGGDRS